MATTKKKPGQQPFEQQRVPKGTPLGKKRRLNARPDTADFRDLLYVPTLVEVPPRLPLVRFKEAKAPILDQGTEGACTGFALATVANFLLRTRDVEPVKNPVSAQMLYTMARRYDEWPGEDYDGSSARGAMKGWHKHGVCDDSLWPKKKGDTALRPDRAEDALRRPLGAYFRVNHKDLVAMHSAISEVGVLYATATVHAGWDAPKKGVIEHSDQIEGGHAFAIVGYDEAGFWIQNSWGPGWGDGGYALLTYDDWLENGSDVWVARLGAYVALKKTDARRTAFSIAAREGKASDFYELRPHIISVGNQGSLRNSGIFGTTKEDVQSIFEQIKETTKGWQTKRILIYAHGGLVPEDDAISKVAKYRAALLEHEVYPLAFIWKTDALTTLKNIFDDAIRKRRPGGVLETVKEFLVEKLDDTLEWAVRGPGKAIWDEIKENAILASSEWPRAGGAGGAQQVELGAARLVATHLNELAKDPSYEFHVVGHSAGSIFHGRLVQQLTTTGIVQSDDKTAGLQGFGRDIASITLWAPACTNDFFTQFYRPAIESGKVGAFTLFTLSDKAERDDTCAGLYNKSLLYLVSNALEKLPRVKHERDGEPILGMAKFADAAIGDLRANGKADWVVGPNGETSGEPDASGSRTHGGFDDDDATLRATLARILAIGKGAKKPHVGPLPVEAGDPDRMRRVRSA